MSRKAQFMKSLISIHAKSHSLISSLMKSLYHIIPLNARDLYTASPKCREKKPVSCLHLLLLYAILKYEVKRMELSYALRNKAEEHPAKDKNPLHAHELYEIYLFLEGEAQYIVEEKPYPLRPGDMMIVRKNQMHRECRMGEKKHRALALLVAPSFFAENDCAEYESHFLKPSLSGSKINAEVVHSSGLYDTMMRLLKYSDNCKNADQPVIRALVLEILYLLHSLHTYPDAEKGNDRLQTVLSYINEHFTSPITLDTICENCFISKYHLCHIFPKITGVTVHRYITGKRLAYVQKLLQEGLTLTQAAHNAGFSTYSSFYRAYLAEHGHSPLGNK